MWVKKNFNLLAGIAVITLTALNLLLFAFGLEYRPYCYQLFVILYSALVCAGTTLSLVFKNQASATSCIFGSFMPLITIVFLASLGASFALDPGNTTYDLIYYIVLISVAVVSSFILFFNFTKNKYIKIIFAIIASAITLFLVSVTLLVAFFAIFPIGTITDYKEIASPNNEYVVIAYISDSGALGGDRIANISKSDPTVLRLISGNISHKKFRVWTDVYMPDLPDIYWQTDTTFIIDRQAFDVNNYY